MNVFRNYVFYALLLVLSFSVSCTHERERNDLVLRNAVKDVDGNKYDAVKIGKQVWMKSNLRTTHFRDKSPIPFTNNIPGTDRYPTQVYFQPDVQTFPAYNKERDGLYYSWLVVADERGLCPKGWHVPNDDEWLELREYVAGKPEYVYGTDYRNIAKAVASQTGWDESDVEGSPGHNPEENNATNLSIVPAGYYAWEYNPTNYGYEAIFWSATEGPDVLYSQYPGSQRDYFASVHKMYGTKPRMITTGSLKYCGFSVRCVRD